MEEKLRMCIACRQMYDKRNLLRIVKDKENNIIVDNTGKKNGRGAYVCKNEDCFKTLCKQKSLNKTFKINVDESVYKTIGEEIFGRKST